ncbi:MAG: hypothetical protein ACXABY_34525 [Candidatus Thorarchaeota archaeon]
MSRKKWGKTAAKTERIIRDAVLKPDVESSINEYLEKTRSVTQFDLANRFGVRMSVARRILRQKESDGVLVPYIREGGLEVYTTPEELEKRESDTPIMIADALEEVASSVPKAKVITKEMDAELIAASGAGSVIKPSRLARQRREAGEKKEEKSKPKLPEVIVEPLAEEETPEPAAEPESKPKKTTKKKAEPKPKKTTKKKADDAAKPKKTTKKKAEPKPKKITKKKVEEEAKPKKAAAKKITKKAEAKPKKAITKKTTKKAEAKPKKTAAKKTTKKADEKTKKTTKKKSDK